MRRFAVLSMVLVVAAVCSSAALADQTAIGNLGRPDQTGTRTFTDAWPLSVPTASCPGFPSTLSFPAVNVPFSESFRVWNMGSSTWFEGVDTFAGSTTVYGSSYSVHGIIFQSRPGETELVGTGKVFVTGSNGARISGDALVYDSAPQAVFVTWAAGGPICK